METIVVDADAATRIGALQEGHFLDRKSFQISAASLSKHLSAFANADGGEIYIGIEDDGTWNGTSTIEDFNGHIGAVEPLFPYGAECDYEFLQHADDGTFVLHITIQKSRSTKVATNGKVYRRRGAQSLPADAADIDREKGITTVETERINYSPEEIENSVATLGFMLGVLPEAEPGPWLRKQRVIIDDLPTVAGTILYNDEPQVHLPKSGVKLYRYTTSDDEGSRENLAFQPVSIEGPAYDVISETVRRTVEEVEAIPVLEAEKGLSAVSYPAETLHEIITNAVLHRDYGVNDDVHVRIFDNRIEIDSPGRLPSGITPENILDQRFSRNPMIVRLINKFPDPPNKDVGEGLNTAFSAMRQLNLTDPEIVNMEDKVRVVVRHEPLASAEDRIVKHLESNGTINNKEARNLLRRPEADRSIRRIFEKMTEAGVIERVPGTTRGGSRYRLVQSALDADPSK